MQRARRKIDDSRNGAQRRVSPRLERIVADLEGIFYAEGFLHFTMDDLARRVHCSKRSLYSLAPSREDIFELIIEERLLAKIRRDGEQMARDTADWIGAVAGYLDVAVKATRHVSAQFVRDLNRFPAGRRHLQEHQRIRVLRLEQLLAVGIENHAFAPVHPRLVAEILMNTVARMSDPDFLASCGLTMADAYSELYYIVLHGLSPRQESVSLPESANRKRVSIRKRPRQTPRHKSA